MKKVGLSLAIVSSLLIITGCLSEESSNNRETTVKKSEEKEGKHEGVSNKPSHSIVENLGDSPFTEKFTDAEQEVQSVFELPDGSIVVLNKINTKGKIFGTEFEIYRSVLKDNRWIEKDKKIYKTSYDDCKGFLGKKTYISCYTDESQKQEEITYIDVDGNILDQYLINEGDDTEIITQNIRNTKGETVELHLDNNKKVYTMTNTATNKKTNIKYDDRLWFGVINFYNDMTNQFLWIDPTLSEEDASYGFYDLTNGDPVKYEEGGVPLTGITDIFNMTYEDGQYIILGYRNGENPADDGFIEFSVIDEGTYEVKERVIYEDPEEYRTILNQYDDNDFYRTLNRDTLIAYYIDQEKKTLNKYTYKFR